MDETLVLLLGTNIGNRLEHLERARLELDAAIGETINQSSIYQSEPWGNPNQQAFLNQVLLMETTLRPLRVLEGILEIEKNMGRHRVERWGPRIIDIDILFYGNMVYESNELKIPHPMMHLRRFTLLPLNEIMPGFIHPLLEKSVAELLETCNDTGDVTAL